MGESNLNFFSLTGGFVILFVGMTSTLYILHAEGGVRGKKFVALFVIQVDNFPNLDERENLIQSATLSQNILIALTILITASSVKSLQAKQGLPTSNQWAGWLALG